MIIGYEYKKAATNKSIFCHKCTALKLADFDQEWLFPIEYDGSEDNYFCCACASILDGGHKNLAIKNAIGKSGNPNKRPQV